MAVPEHNLGNRSELALHQRETCKCLQCDCVAGRRDEASIASQKQTCIRGNASELEPTWKRMLLPKMRVWVRKAADKKKPPKTRVRGAA